MLLLQRSGAETGPQLTISSEVKMVADMHSHVLPEMDDGSSCVEESIAMLRKTWDGGIKVMTATPHFYAGSDTPDAFFDRRSRSVGLLAQEMKKHQDLPEIKLGAEVSFFHGMSDSEVLQRLTIADGWCILVEMPHTVWTDGMYEELTQIRSKQGLIPVIAHVERYMGLPQGRRILERLESMPVLIQANASFFLNRFTSHMAMRMLRQEQVHLIGSDCHNMSSRKPNLSEAVDKIRTRLGQSALDRIAEYQEYVFKRDI